jgi:intraflagellar transport protein 140
MNFVFLQAIQTSVMLVSLFTTTDHGIVVQDVKPIADENCRLLGVQSPHIIILNSEKSLDKNSKIIWLLMRDFEELGNCDSITKKAVMDFSYHISVANMDEAFKAIKSIKNETVWKSLAKMCVKTKQLNMALLCLGHMKQASAARALREAMQDDSLSLEAQVGILAVELNLHVSFHMLNIYINIYLNIFLNFQYMIFVRDFLDGCGTPVSRSKASRFIRPIIRSTK